ncbi:hypothetical protein EI94DRAFT_1710020 [Lactarius quietus]|nr:hypothetical protein EI94DRAFT_1710020 [Lactarius quietus]
MPSPEHIASPLPQGSPKAHTPPQNLKGGLHLRGPLLGVLNFRNNLLANAISAQKAEDRKISWVEFTPQFHSHLVKCTVALVPHPVHKVKWVIFGFILELLNEGGHLAFFKLQKGGHKANNAQKEKRHLAQKQHCAAKHKWDCEAAKVVKLPVCEQQCKTCGRKFESHKTACKHKCPVAKGESVREEATVEPAKQAAPPALLNKPAALITPHAPSAPSNNNPRPVVTGDSLELNRALHSGTRFDLISPDGNRLTVIDPRSDGRRAHTLYWL